MSRQRLVPEHVRNVAEELNTTFGLCVSTGFDQQAGWGVQKLSTKASASVTETSYTDGSTGYSVPVIR